MKIKNLAFFGIMAAILGVNGAARADSTTIIASQAYVDAKDALKQNNLGGGTNAGKAVIATGTAGTVEYRAISSNASTADSTDLLTAGAINTAITNATPAASNYVEDSITDGHTDKAPSGNAVYDEIHVANNGNYIRSANTVAANLGALDTATKDAADAAAAAQTTADSKWATENVAVQGGYDKGWSDESVKQESDRDNNSNLGGAKTQKDKYVPTMLAVEKYVAANAGTSIGSATQTASDNEVVTSVSTNNGKVSSVTSTKIKNAHVSSTAGDEIEATKLKLTSGYTAASTDADVAAGDQVETAIGKLAKRSKDNQTNIGTLTNLSTTAQNNLVAAINEVDGHADAAQSAADAAQSTADAAQSAANAAQTTADSKWATANVAIQGNYTKGWDDRDVASANDTTNESNLGGAKEEMDKYVPTMAAVEKRVLAAQQAAIDAAGQAASSHIGSDTKNATSGELVTGVTTTNGVVTAVSSTKVADANVADNAAIKATKSVLSSTYATASTNEAVAAADSVETAISKLAKKAADNETNITTNTNAITTLNGTVSEAGSVLKSIKDSAESATFTPGNSGITATNLADAIKEVKTTAASGVSNLDYTDNDNTGQPVVKVNQTDGTVSPTHGTITYAAGLDYKLSNVDTTGGDAHERCSVGSPCTLTMIWSNGKPVYEWTNMDTEDTNALL